MYTVYAHKMKRMHSFLAKCILRMQKKNPKILVNRQCTPEKQNEPPTLWKRGSQGALTTCIKTIGSSVMMTYPAKPCPK